MSNGKIASEHEIIKLTTQSEDGKTLTAFFNPAKGMNLMSYKKGEIEVIDQETYPLFEDRYSGLGPLIGPHFHHRKVIPPVKNESLFPHIERLKSRGVNEPFSHGIGRYAPWKVLAATPTYLEAVLKGTDEWHGIPLKELEGQNFTMHYRVEMTSSGLVIYLSVNSDTTSVVGLHTYYKLDQGRGKITTTAQDHYNDQGVIKPIPSTWNYSYEHRLAFELTPETAIDFGFRSFPDPLQGTIYLDTKTHRLSVHYTCDNEENSFQLWHPSTGVSFVCIEPLSAKEPRRPQLSVSKLKILISIHNPTML